MPTKNTCQLTSLVELLDPGLRIPTYAEFCGLTPEEFLNLTGDTHAMGKIENRENVKAGRNVKGKPTVESTRTRKRKTKPSLPEVQTRTRRT